MFIFVYGTLMKREVANRNMDGCKYHSRARVVGHTLFDLGHFPAAVPCSDPKAEIWGELWQLPEELDDQYFVMDRLRRYEGDQFIADMVIVESHCSIVMKVECLMFVAKAKATSDRYLSEWNEASRREHYYERRKMQRRE